MSVDDAAEELRRNAGTQFDPDRRRRLRGARRRHLAGARLRDLTGVGVQALGRSVKRGAGCADVRQACPATCVHVFLLCLAALIAGCGGSSTPVAPDEPGARPAAQRRWRRQRAASTGGGIGDATTRRSRRHQAPPGHARSPAGRTPSRASAPAPPATNTDLAPARDNLPAVVALTLCLLNGERADAGLGPLKPNAKLASAAVEHSRDMVDRAVLRPHRQGRLRPHRPHPRRRLHPGGRRMDGRREPRLGHRRAGHAEGDRRRLDAQPGPPREHPARAVQGDRLRRRARQPALRPAGPERPTRPRSAAPRPSRPRPPASARRAGRPGAAARASHASAAHGPRDGASRPGSPRAPRAIRASPSSASAPGRL